MAAVVDCSENLAGHDIIMTAQEEVQTISNKLEALVKENISGSAEVTEYLHALQKAPIDLTILQSTNIGRTVNNLRKETKNKEVESICKSLVKCWKSLLTPDSANGGGGVGSGSGSTEPERKKAKKEDGANDDNYKSSPATKERLVSGTLSRSSSSSSFSSSPTPTTPTAKSAPVKAPAPISVKSTTAGSTSQPQTNGDTSTRDEVRIRSRELLEKALLKDTPPEGAGDAGTIAAEIETAIFKEFRNTDVKYKNRIRSRIMCIQDSKNPRLRENILLGVIPSERIAVMTSEEMASKEMKELRDRLSKEATEGRQMATTGGTETDLFQCGKCRQKKCTYNQVQTRSADEPMTTFVYCTNCGNRWKFC
ncbi:Transcription elongation factor A protein 1 [Hypsibius exemplaris]|uniref:Transcription elongation factor n=1 Tax=Hypsibius exemplaris TaxID=2072580 RepID=A0A1W0WJI5_HYPEX|nr:Transcription elongation factor A protein 1 [Hypsibius exemplaris]